MSRIVYVNGDYLPEEEAKISVFDRGFLFSDGVYEVVSVLDGKLIDNPAHMRRLNRSLGELDMATPCSAGEIEEIQKRLVAENSIGQGLVYLQITRGAADRDFLYPENTTPTLVMFTQSKNLLDDPNVEHGIDVITVPDLRWMRRDIKTIGLLYPCMAKMIAKDAGAKDAWMLDSDGNITEGTSNNAWIITREGTIVTRHLSNDILHGITRKAVMALAEQRGYQVEQRPFTPAEAYVAAEAFITSATTFVMPVVKIDDATIGDGLPGEMAGKLREIYIDMALHAG
jgi:D-alanine transaminase